MTAIEQYLGSQKNWPTRLLAKRQLDFVGCHIIGDVLDVGCGDGIVAAIYGDGVTSCDIEDNNKYGIKVDIALAEDLPYPDSSFDTVCLIGVIEHTGNPAKAIAECWRVSKASLIITYPKGFGWKILKTILPRPGINLHAKFEMNGQMSEWLLFERKSIIPMFFTGEVYKKRG